MVVKIVKEQIGESTKYYKRYWLPDTKGAYRFVGKIECDENGKKLNRKPRSPRSDKGKSHVITKGRSDKGKRRGSNGKERSDKGKPRKITKIRSDKGCKRSIYANKPTKTHPIEIIAH